jgi:hypothetical protein
MEARATAPRRARQTEWSVIPLPTHLIQYLAFVPEQNFKLLQQLRMVRLTYGRDFPGYIIFDIVPVISM